MHFLLMVIGENPEQQLAPYSGETVYVPQVDTALTPESIIEHLQSAVQKLQLYANDPSQLEQADRLNQLLDDILQSGYEEGVRRHLEFFQEYMLTHYDCEIDAALRPVLQHNPLLKFDGHVMGGRWRGRLKLNPGARGGIGPEEKGGWPKAGFVDQCRRQDLDLAGTLDAAIAEVTQRWDDTWQRNPHVLPFDQKREEYIETATREELIPEAIIENGQYDEAASYTQEDWEARVHRRLQELPPDRLITLYDCHQ